jgi:hypothetical protein
MNAQLQRRIRTLISSALVCGALLIAGGAAWAGFTNPFTPTWRGQPDTEYGGWESFTSAVGGQNFPDLPQATTLDASIVQHDATAFLTGGNIYSFSAPLSLTLSDTVPGVLLELYLQTSTKGSELDYNAVKLRYIDSQGQTQLMPWTSYTQLAYNSTMGVEVESLFRWDFSGLGQSISAYDIVMESAAPSMSLDAVALDTRFTDAIVTYCTAKVNSQGCLTAIDFSGVPSASSSAPFHITALLIRPNVVGVLLYGTNGPASLPYQGGTLCMAPPVVRMSPKSAGGSGSIPCSGSFSEDFNLRIQGGLDPKLVAGQQVQAQYWSRDPGFPAATATNLTDALQFVIQD